MEPPEAGFHAWILTGNALHLLLHRVPAESFADATLRERLARLDEELKDFPPEETLARIHALPSTDKTLLATACRQAMSLAKDNVESLLGLTVEEAEAVLRLLQHESGH
jgi:hypothetical protein